MPVNDLSLDLSAPRSDVAMDAGTDARPTELCNGIDDDADGTEDEGLGLGMTCVSGRGECRQPGLIVCVGDGLADCSGIATAPGIESCDDLDNDCDGNVDELGASGCYPPGANRAVIGVGLCATGFEVCADSPGAEPRCVHAIVPVAELCNSLDDDCDGAVDENFPVRRGCDFPAGACVLPGVIACDPVALDAACAAVEPRPLDICNGDDDDCDGELDEDSDLACYTGSPETREIGACVPGLQACVNGQPGACEGQVLPQGELQNELDDDCDGTIDEEP